MPPPRWPKSCVAMMADDKPHSHLTGRKPHFTLGARLGTGNHSEVYHAVDEETGEDCAVKVESIVHHTPMLLFESKLLRSLAKEPYMPLLRNRGYLLMDLKYVSARCTRVQRRWPATRPHPHTPSDPTPHRHYMLMDLAGPTLHDLKHTILPVTVLKIADQLIERFEQLHEKHFVHRSVKPRNIALGLPHSCLEGKVLLIDFGRAARWRDSKSYQIKPATDPRANYRGPYYSVNACRGVRQSRRDDMIALGHVLIELNNRDLPWNGSLRSELDTLLMLDAKMSTSVEQLCAGLAPEYALYMNHCLALKYADAPDYVYLRRLFHSCFCRTSSGTANDGASVAGQEGWSDLLPCDTLPRTAPGGAQEKERGEPCVPTDHIRVRCVVWRGWPGGGWQVGVALVVGGW